MPLNPTCHKKVVITGAGGEYGRLIIEKLIQHAPPTSLILVTGELSPALNVFAAQGCVVRQCSADGPENTLAVAFAGGHTLLLLPEAGGCRLEQQQAAVSAAITAGIEHLVLISIIGAERDYPSAYVAQDSKIIEHRLQSEALHWTILRDSQYSETLSDAAGPRALRMRRCVCNIGNGRIGFVCRKDSAACAAVVLKDPEMHRRRIYHLTGPELVSIRDVMDILEDLEGLERGAIGYEQVPDDHLADFLANYGIPRQRDLSGSAHGIFNVPDMVSFGRACRLGEMAIKTDDVELLTGNPPQSIREVFWRRRSWMNDFPWRVKELEADFAKSSIT